MTSPDDGSPVKPQPTFTPISPIYNPKTRSPEEHAYLFPTINNAPSIRSSIASERVSRSNSPNGRLSMSMSRFGRSSVASSLGLSADSYDDTRSLMIRAFCPPVAIYASADADDLARSKGFNNGFQEMLRPYGEKVTGKMVIRDSTGASRAWDDFGLKFVELGAEPEEHMKDAKYATPHARLEELLERYIELPMDDPATPLAAPQFTPADSQNQISPYYRLLLTRLLSAHRIATYETFLHPVACVIVISSHTFNPIEQLRQLYSHTAQGAKVQPAYVNPEYLRYYVLVHDEERDDFSKSASLFDQMKRHFGLHCHLLRIRSTTCLPGDHDSVEVPFPEWLSPAEDVSRLNDTDNLIEIGSKSRYLFDSDVSAIKSFVRELAAQSVIPHMENRVATWNEQIASKRRGISGRFMSLGKRWAGIGGLAGATRSVTNIGGAGGASGNYDSLQGWYRWETPEATLRKLADYAFMLRDYRLASSTYEMLRGDFNNDKAWKYTAAANEMCVVSNLLNPMAAPSKTKLESFEQMIESASYSYLTRSSDPTNALRCITLGVELLKVRGQVAAELAAKWSIIILQMGLVGAVGQVLVSERIAACFAAHVGPTSSRQRKAALWNVMAAEQWMKLGKAEFAAERLDDADHFYDAVEHTDGIGKYMELSDFLSQLKLAVSIKRGQASSRGHRNAPNILDLEEEETEEMTEQLDAVTRRISDVGLGPRSPVTPNRPDPFSRTDDDFE